MSKVSRRIREARQRRYRTAKEFAEKHDMPYSTYRSHESGDRIPPNETVRQYAKLLGVEYMWLLHGDDLPYGYGSKKGGMGDSGYTGKVFAATERKKLSATARATVESAEFMLDFYEAFNKLSPLGREKVLQQLAFDISHGTPSSKK